MVGGGCAIEVDCSRSAVIEEMECRIAFWMVFQLATYTTPTCLSTLGHPFIAPDYHNTLYLLAFIGVDLLKS